MSATRGGRVSNTGTPEVRQDKDTGRTRGGSNRVPAGKSKQTFSLDQDVVVELNASVDGLGQDLRGLVPKHAILAAVLRAGIAQADQVRAGLRRDLLQGLDVDG